MAVKASDEITLTRVDDGVKGDTGATGAKGADGKMLYATSSTAESTAAKVATLSSGTLTLAAGVSVSVKFTYGNTAASPTLNISDTGAKAIYTQGVRYAYWQAGATVVLTYDGSAWRVASEPVYANTVTVGNASGRNLYIDSDSVDIRSGSTTLATFTENALTLGKASNDAKIDMCNGNIEFSTKVYTGSNTGVGQITAQNGIGIYANGTGEGDGDGGIDIGATRMLDLRGKQIEVLSTDSTFVASNEQLDMYAKNIYVTCDVDATLNGQSILAGGVANDYYSNNVAAFSGSGNVDYVTYTVPADGIYMVTGGYQYKGTSPANRIDFYVHHIHGGAEKPYSSATVPYSQSYPCGAWCGTIPASKGDTIRLRCWHGVAGSFNWIRNTITRLK